MSHYIEVVERYLVPDLPPIARPYEDGVPLETNWHRIQINLLVDNVRQFWSGRSDFFVGGNMFVYYSMKQVRNRDYKGPDFFLVKGVDGAKERKSWIAWDEDARLPDLIVELLSPTTAALDLGEKKNLYEGNFKTPEYYCYDPDSGVLHGWRLSNSAYAPIAANTDGRLWSNELGAFLGLWHGEYQGMQAPWIRLFGAEGDLIPTAAEAQSARAEAAEGRAEAAEGRAEAAEARIEAERVRALSAEIETARLREELQRLQDGGPPNPKPE
jgi:Uma2 family endonuclease